jgi:hypothetical protein
MANGCESDKAEPKGPCHFYMREMLFPGRRGRDREGIHMVITKPQQKRLLTAQNNIRPLPLSIMPTCGAAWSMPPASLLAKKRPSNRVKGPVAGFEPVPDGRLSFGNWSLFATLQEDAASIEPIYFNTEVRVVKVTRNN